MRLETQKHLHDIRRGAGLPREFLDGRTFAEHDGYAALRSAAERCRAIE